jgi:hypothetical protein
MEAKEPGQLSPVKAVSRLRRSRVARALTGLRGLGSGLPSAYRRDCANPAHQFATLRMVPFGMLISRVFLTRATLRELCSAKLLQVKTRPYDRRFHAAASGFYLALLIGRVVRLISPILASFLSCDKVLCATPERDAPRQQRVLMRRALFRAHRRREIAAARQRGSRRGALFHRHDGATSQALRRGPHGT